MPFVRWCRPLPLCPCCSLPPLSAALMSQASSLANEGPIWLGPSRTAPPAVAILSSALLLCCLLPSCRPAARRLLLLCLSGVAIAGGGLSCLRAPAQPRLLSSEADHHAAARWRCFCCVNVHSRTTAFRRLERSHRQEAGQRALLVKGRQCRKKSIGRPEGARRGFEGCIAATWKHSSSVSLGTATVPLSPRRSPAALRGSGMNV